MSDAHDTGVLPETADEKRRRLGLAQLVSGTVSFATYMEHALYHPDFGYYSAPGEQFGAGGDFVTAPEVSPLFASCVARQCADVLDGMRDPSVTEIGAGTGRLAADIINALDELGSLPSSYRIVEKSPALRARQRTLIEESVPQFAERVVWLDEATPANGVVLANEVLDALPVERIRLCEGKVEQMIVQSDGEHISGTWQAAPAELESAVSAIDKLSAQKAGSYETEICLELPAFVQSAAKLLDSGALLFADYGYSRDEYYDPARSSGTLRCHYRQRAHDNPFYRPGCQDITAWADFTSVLEAGIAAGLVPAGYTTQANFLLALGLAEMCPRIDDERARIEYARDVRRLTLPDEMGERFKVLAFKKAYDRPLAGFSLRDLMDRLST